MVTFVPQVASDWPFHAPPSCRRRRAYIAIQHESVAVHVVRTGTVVVPRVLPADSLEAGGCATGPAVSTGVAGRAALRARIRADEASSVASGIVPAAAAATRLA